MTVAVPIAPTPRILLRRSYRFTGYWIRRFGPHAGKILALLPPAALVFLFVALFLANTVCSFVAAFDACLGFFDLLMTLGGLAASAILVMSLGSLIVRLLTAVRKRRLRRSAERSLAQLRARLGETDALADPAFASLHLELQGGDAADAQPRRIGILLGFASLLVGLFAALLLLILEASFSEYGSLLILEATARGFQFLTVQALFVTTVALGYRVVRDGRDARRLARERWQDLETRYEAAAEELVRRQRRPRTAPEGPGFTFRSYLKRSGMSYP